MAEKDSSKLGMSCEDAALLARIRAAAADPVRARADVAHRFVETNAANIACHGKLAIRTPEHAEKLSLVLADRHGHPLEWYHCIVCGCYHLTTNVRPG